MRQVMETNIDKTGLEKKPKPKPKQSPIVMGGVIFVVAMAAWYFYGNEPVEKLNSAIPEPGPLLQDSASCSDVGDTAISRAYELEEAAMAKFDRYRFHAHDGVQGFELLLIARSCYLSGNDRENAMNAEVKLKHWKTLLEQQYKNHQMKLRVALDREAYRDALNEARSLLNLLRGRQGPYVEWLIFIERKLEAKVL